MAEKRMQTSKRHNGWSEGGIGVGTGLALIGLALLSMGTSAKIPSSSHSVAAATSIERAPAELTLANADRDTLDLQLD